MHTTPHAGSHRGPEFRCFIDREGRTIDFQVLGTGSPTVILDAGFQSGLTTWDQVAPKIASFATVLMLDRCCLLGSASRPLVIEPLPAARQIQQLLEHTRLAEPIIPVGWAIGCIYARAFAGNNHSSVTGMVLVDDVPEEFLREVLDPANAGTTSEYCRTLLAEVDGLTARNGRNPLELLVPRAPLDLPATRISRGNYPPIEDAVAQRWIQLQRQYLREMTMLREVIAGRSGHAIPAERPDVIVDAVGDLTTR